jgi:hypothetical protein
MAGFLLFCVCCFLHLIPSKNSFDLIMS